MKKQILIIILVIVIAIGSFGAYKLINGKH